MVLATCGPRPTVLASASALASPGMPGNWLYRLLGPPTYYDLGRGGAAAFCVSIGRLGDSDTGWSVGMPVEGF